MVRASAPREAVGLDSNVPRILASNQSWRRSLVSGRAEDSGSNPDHLVSYFVSQTCQSEMK